MPTHQEIKRFVQETLGCSCPEEVFNKIDHQKGSNNIWGQKVNIGDRLLIYIINADSESEIPELLLSSLEKGVAERNQKGFNRFRLVLAVSRPDELYSLAEKAFQNSEYIDEKTHLHVVNKNAASF